MYDIAKAELAVTRQRNILFFGIAATLVFQVTGIQSALAQHQSVADDHDDIVRVLRETAARADAVLVSGGLGPTSDDLTAAAAAKAFGRPLIRFDEALEHVRCFFARRGREMSANNIKQADLPAGCTVLANYRGTAPGFAANFSRALM